MVRFPEVVSPNEIYFHPTIPLPAGKRIRLLPLCRKAESGTFKCCLPLDSKKSFN